MRKPRANVHLSAHLGKIHLALSLGQTGFFFWGALVVALRAAHAFDVQR